MKRLLVMVAVLLLCTPLAYADVLSIGDTIEDLPVVQNGIAYSLADSRFNYLATMELANFKGISLAAGYAGVAENTKDKLVATLTYDLVKVKDLGVTFPVLDLLRIEPGIYAGFGRINLKAIDKSEKDYGLVVKCIDWKF